jgi:YVTN family beta-propeller protein
MRRWGGLLAFIAAVSCASAARAQEPRFHVLAFYSANAEPDHVQFAEDALKFFGDLAAKQHFAFAATTEWGKLNDADPNKYQLIVWLNGSPTEAEQRRAFQKYMESGGAWMGFHAAGYNDKDTNWPWFVDFLGGAVFHINSWPPLPAKLLVDDRAHPVTLSIPEAYVSPANEWYVWKPSPRLNPDVQVLVTLDPANYPLGLKDVVTSGDLPVVWTNKKYKMVYMNMGHGDRIFTSPTQDKLIENATLWLASKPSPADSSAAAGLRVSPQAVEVNPKTNKVYAVNRGADTVTVIDSRGLVTPVRVGTAPGAIAVNPVMNKVYVGNEGSGTVSVIDGATDRVTATVKVGDLPYVVAANPISNKVYVSKTFSNSMTVIDGTTNATSMKEGIEADAMAVMPGNGWMFLVNYESNVLTAIDGTSENTSAIAVVPHSWGIGVNPATNKIYLGTTGGSNVAVISGAAAYAVRWVHTGKIPCAFAADPRLNRVYVANYASNDVTVLDGTSNSVLATIKAGEHPRAIAVNPSTHMVFVANAHGNSVTVIDGTNNIELATVSVGSGPYAIAVDSAADKAYVVGLTDTLTVIDGKTLRTAAVAAPTEP